MKLKKLIIENFRSIQDLVIDVDENLLVLLGKNEAGKSNILKAFSLLSTESNISQDDIRDRTHDEEPEIDTEVTFVFAFDETDFQRIADDFSKKFYSLDSDATLLIQDGKRLNLSQLVHSFDEGLYVVKLNEKYGTWWTPPTDYEVATELVTFDAEMKETILDEDGNDVEDEYTFYVKDSLLSIEKEGLTDPSLVLDSLKTVVVNHVVNNLPKLVIWKYSEDNLLPGRIEITDFCENRHRYVPMKNIFSLAGIRSWEIKDKIEEASTKSNGMRNLLRRVSASATEHVQRVWADAKGLKISITQNGEVLEAGIEDEYNVFDLARRSDGFKRFITFMLLVGTPSESGTLSNSIILFDEPDTSLHPSGVKYLKDELDKIAENNNVIYSTHSIYMIDRENYNRNVIVEKDNEVTNIKRPNTSDIVDEEVFYHAIGTSIFEYLKETNLIFEGWKDKHLFRIALTARRKGFSISKELKSRGTCHARGVKDIERVAAIVELSGREFYIVSDADQPAKEKKRNYADISKWFLYSDLGCNDKFVTAEDFIKIKPLIKALKSCQLKYKSLKSLNVKESDFNELSSFLPQVQSLVKSSFVDNAELKNFLFDLKNTIFQNLKATDIRDEYFTMLTKLEDQITKKS